MPPVLPNSSEVKRYTLPADRHLVEPLRNRFIEEISQSNVPESDLTQWKLIFNELVFNAIFHGAKEAPQATIVVEWALLKDSVLIAAQDPGEGPPAEALINPTLPEDPAAESGRGLFIMHQFADEFRHWRGSNGFRLEIIKHYPGLGEFLKMDPELERTLEELSSCYESLSVFHRLTVNLIESANLRKFIDDSINEFLALHPLDRIFFQGAPQIPQTTRAILHNATWFLDPSDADSALRSLGNLTRETVWESREDLVRQNLNVEALHSAGAGCVFPIVAGDIHFGALVVLRKPSPTPIQFRSLGTLRTLADLCGIACANAHLATIRDESQRDLRELEIAVEIQKALLPIEESPASRHWQVAIHQDSSLSIAGDYAIARTAPDGTLVIAIIDVMGKGVSAALLASIFKTAFSLALHLPSSAEILNTINRCLCDQLGNLTMFITCAIARISPDGKKMDHASAGHCPTFFYDPSGVRTFIEPSGPPLGILPDMIYQNDESELTGGERLVFITDGCYEWDRKDESQGWPRFVEFVDSHLNSPPDILWTDLKHRIQTQCGDDLEDDCTFLTLDIFP